MFQLVLQFYIVVLLFCSGNVLCVYIYIYIYVIVGCRSGEVVYRIVGFEVDPRSVSIESFVSSDKEKSAKDAANNKDPFVSVEPGTKCVIPPEVAVAELEKGSM